MTTIPKPGAYVVSARDGERHPVYHGIAGFVGAAASGPIHSPRLIESFGEFEQVFGKSREFSNLSDAVHGFFANGGRRCWVVRVAYWEPSRTVFAAYTYLVDPHGRRRARIRGATEGAWSGDIRVTVMRSTKRFRLTYLVEEADADAMSISVAATDDLAVGDECRLVTRAGDSAEVTIDSIELDTGVVHLRSPLTRKMGAGSRVLGHGLRILARHGDRDEDFDQLSLNRAHHNFVELRVNGSVDSAQTWKRCYERDGEELTDPEKIHRAFVQRVDHLHLERTAIDSDGRQEGLHSNLIRVVTHPPLRHDSRHAAGFALERRLHLPTSGQRAPIELVESVRLRDRYPGWDGDRHASLEMGRSRAKSDEPLPRARARLPGDAGNDIRVRVLDPSAELCEDACAGATRVRYRGRFRPDPGQSVRFFRGRRVVDRNVVTHCTTRPDTEFLELADPVGRKVRTGTVSIHGFVTCTLTHAAKAGETELRVDDHDGFDVGHDITVTLSDEPGPRIVAAVTGKTEKGDERRFRLLQPLPSDLPAGASVCAPLRLPVEGEVEAGQTLLQVPGSSRLDLEQSVILAARFGDEVREAVEILRTHELELGAKAAYTIVELKSRLPRAFPRGTILTSGEEAPPESRAASAQVVSHTERYTSRLRVRGSVTAGAGQLSIPAPEASDAEYRQRLRVAATHSRGSTTELQLESPLSGDLPKGTRVRGRERTFDLEVSCELLGDSCPDSSVEFFSGLRMTKESLSTVNARSQLIEFYKKDLLRADQALAPSPDDEPTIGRHLSNGAGASGLALKWYTGYSTDEQGGTTFIARTSGENVSSPECGLALFERIEEIDYIAMPDIEFSAQFHHRVGTHETYDLYESAHRWMIEHCARVGTRLAILDLPFGTPVETAAGWPERLHYCKGSENAALYYPWLKVVHAAGDQSWIPPSGHIGGIHCAIDIEDGIAAARAGRRLLTVAGINDRHGAQRISEAEVGRLSSLGVNCLESQPGSGIRVVGARTVKNRGPWRYLTTRRLVLGFLKRALSMLRRVAFEANSRGVRARVEETLGSLLYGAYTKGLLRGSNPSESYSVQCDDENNPPEVVDRGELVVEVRLALIVPAEFITLKIQRRAGSLSVTEEVEQ